MMASSLTVFHVVLCSMCVVTVLADPGNLQDACPTAPGKHAFFINGLPCKNPADISASDFKSSKLNHAGKTDKTQQSSFNIATANDFPGLNTLGLSIARTDIEVGGVVNSHSHPRSSEILFVQAGILVAGFIDTNNQVFQKIIQQGDVFVFPRGLLHYLFNLGFESAMAYSVFNSQNPGVVSLSSFPFGLDTETLNKMKKEFLSSRIGNNTLNSDSCPFCKMHEISANKIV